MLDDGIYLVKRGFDSTLGSEKISTVSAYNDVESHTWNAPERINRPSNQIPNFITTDLRTLDGFEPTIHPIDSTYNYKYVQPNSNHSIIAMVTYNTGGIDDQVNRGDWYNNVYSNSDAVAIFNFTDPAVSSGTVTNVSVQAYVRGQCAVVMRDGMMYKGGDPNHYVPFVDYGTASATDSAEHWITKDYPVRPTPTYPDVAVTAPQPNTPYKITDKPLGGIWMAKNSGECYEIKLVITYIDSSGNIQTETRYPISDNMADGVTQYVRKMHGNPLYNSDTYPISGLYYYADYIWSENYGHSPIPIQPSANVYYASNFSSFPPSSSQINKIVLHFNYNVSSGATLTPYLLIGGTRYYGTALSSTTPTDATFTWDSSTLPTSDYSKLSSAAFGIRVTRNQYAGAFLYKLYADIYYQEPVGETVSYDKMSINRESTIFVQYPQNPINPDVLYFTSNYPVPERTEIVYVRSGVHVFHGIVTYDDELKSKWHHVTAKSMQCVLDYRYCAPFFYYVRRGRFTRYYSLGELFSDTVPDYPFWQYIGGKGNRKYSTINGFRDIMRKQYTNIGLLFLLNSTLTAESSSDHFVDCADRVSGKALFSYQSTPEIINEHYYDYTGVPYSTQYPWWYSGYATLVQTPNQCIGGISRLSWRSSPPCSNLEYSVIGNDLYVMPYPDSHIVLAENCSDTHIRLGDFELSSKYLNMPYVFGNNTWSKTLDTFFENLGQEIQFRAKSDGNVYLNASTEISRGSATSPLRKFEHNINCRITIRKNWEPKPTLTIGKSTIPQVAGSFDISNTIILKTIEDAVRDGIDLKNYLEFQALQDQTSYNVEYNREEPLLLVGDWIWIKPENAKDYIALRIKQNTTKNNFTQLVVGKTLPNMTKQWGQWRNYIGTLGTDHKFTSQAIDLNGTGGTQSFTVNSSDLSSDEYRCRLNLTVDYHIDKDPTLSLITHASHGGASAEIVGTYTGTGAIGYALQIFRSHSWQYDYVNAEWIFNRPQYQYAQGDGAGNWGAWSPVLILPSDDIAPLGNGLSLHIIYDHGSSGGWPNIAGSAWEIYALSPLKIQNYNQTMLRLKMNGKAIPPGRIVMTRDNNSLDMDITSYVSSGTNTLDVYLQGGLLKVDSPNWYHTETGSIDQYKRVAAVLDA